MIRWSELSVPVRDALVAEKVMEWEQVPTDDEWGEGWATPNGLALTGACPDGVRSWSPSTSIADAWEVVDGFYWWRVSKMHEMYGEGCEAYVRKLKDGIMSQFGAHADTAPEAICIAALRAVGVEVEL